MTGGVLGSTTTSRSPCLLSVLNMGASVLTSHRYLQYSVQYSTIPGHRHYNLPCFCVKLIFIQDGLYFRLLCFYHLIRFIQCLFATQVLQNDEGWKYKEKFLRSLIDLDLEWSFPELSNCKCVSVSPARAGQAGVGEDQPAAVARRLLTTFHAFTAALNLGVRRETWSKYCIAFINLGVWQVQQCGDCNQFYVLVYNDKE